MCINYFRDTAVIVRILPITLHSTPPYTVSPFDIHRPPERNIVSMIGHTSLYSVGGAE